MNHEDCNLWTSKNYDYLYRYAQRKLDDQEIIKDLIQDTFLAALERYDKFEQKSSELTWLTAILKYKIYRVYQGRARQRSTVSIEADRHSKNGVNVEAELSPSEAIDALLSKEFNSALRQHLSQLPVLWQEVYELYFLTGLNGPAICDKLNLSSGNYWVITHRLKKSLKNWYMENWM